MSAVPPAAESSLAPGGRAIQRPGVEGAFFHQRVTWSDTATGGKLGLARSKISSNRD
jgi:hypothetical protein